jgi:penicillin G amidase
MKWLGRLGWLLLTVLILAVMAAAVAWFVYRDRVLPVTEGTLAVPGLKGEVRIERDAHGIPTIRAAAPEDAYFALGFVHAQDRLWQLETHRRIGAGRLAEAFGAGALENDKFLRALGVRRAAAAQWANTQGEGRAVMLAYTAGINAFLKQHLRARPPEFLMLGVQPEPWDPVDSMAWGIMMAWDLGGNWSAELLRMKLAHRLPVARINELLPPYAGEQPLATADYAELVRQWQVAPGLGRQAMRHAPESGIEGVGSNNWVVGGTHTESGKPLLANDPHLKLTTPALWYFARIETPGYQLAGATMPGLPLMVLGQNEHIAWGFTNTGPDVQDLYLERIKADDPSRYQTPDGWAAFETFDEVIKVKGAADVKLSVRASRHGPVISDAGAPSTQALGSGYALAMRWTALDANAGFLGAAPALGRSRSVDEFIAASAGYVAPMQNMVVADAFGPHGHIAFVAAGRVPVRSPQHDLRGLVPAPGWDARYDWLGFVPANETPREIDPPRGWIATANQRIHEPGYPHFLTSEWAAPYRQQRIEQLLAATPKHSMDSLAAIQADVVSLGAQKLVPALRRARSAHPLAAALAGEIANFDGTMAADRAMPAVYHAWARHLTELVFADELGPLWASEFTNNRSFRDGLEGVISRDDAWWCDDKATPAAEVCAERAGEALTRALDELQARLGGDPARWRWGDVHVSRAEHRPFSRAGALARFFELRVGVGGDGHTVNVARVNLLPDKTTGERYLNDHGPSLRALYDLRERANSRFMHSSGQSGIALSPHYSSMLADWSQTRYVPVWADGSASELLRLVPR